VPETWRRYKPRGDSDRGEQADQNTPADSDTARRRTGQLTDTSPVCILQYLGNGS